MKLLLLDNYDSFVYNLAQALRSLGVQPEVVRNDAWSLERVRAFAPEAIVISPGPGHPADPQYFGVCADTIRELGMTIPTLGVCLGHQGIAHVFGAEIVRAARVMHGKSSAIEHDETGLFAGLPRGFSAMRYHSLVVEPARLPSCLQVTAWTDDGTTRTIMALAHVTAPLYGVQFHPESIGTPLGPRLLARFLTLARQHHASRLHSRAP